MVHRVILGAIERFIGVLIEHFAGNFPLWISPVQAKILNVTDSQAAYAQEICNQLRGQGVRVQVDLRNEKLSFKIREAQLEKVPYMLVIGDKEVASATVAPRHRSGQTLEPMAAEAFARLIAEECRLYH
jgi:threonyl-tRNA synthetase